MKYRPHILKALAALVALMCTLIRVAPGQQAQLDSITKKFDTYRRQALQEKLYVHLDQHFYLTGETAWFSLYYVDGSFHKPLNISKVAYIEILDRNNSAVLQIKVDLANGRGKGSAFLPATIPSGNYTFRAYTQWMKNFGAAFYFQREITIINPFIKPDIARPSGTREDHCIDFFPEGGHLVNGLPCKVAFKIADAGGNGIHRTGAIINQDNDTLVTFTPHKFGMGQFLFTPVTGQTYRAVIRDGNGRASIHALPKIKDTGYVMTVAERTDDLVVTVNGRFSSPEEASFVFLLAHSRNVITHAALKLFQIRQCEFILDKKSLQEGINHITVLDADQRPVCERLYFKQPAGKLNISARTDQQQYGTRRKVTLQLHAGTGEQQMPANLSVAVKNADSLSAGEDNIFHYLMLSSDLQGKIESPEFYFTPNDPEAIRAADNLMLTHGWRKFNWDKVLSSAVIFAHIPEYRGHIVRAKATQARDTTAGRILTYLAAPGKEVLLRGARSNARGELLFDVGHLKGQCKMIMLTSPEQSGNARLEIQNPFSAEPPAAAVSPLKLSADIEKKFLERSIAMQVQDIYYEETTAPAEKPSTDSIAFYGQADETYYLDRYTRFPVMEEVMREYVPGVFVRKRKDGFHFIVIDAINKGIFSEDPMILLDGVPLFDADRIMEIDPRKIRKLEVVKKKYHLGPLTMSGIVSYTSYLGDVAGMELDPGSISLNYEGLQLYREFSSPHYENQKQFSSRIPDRRYLVYWNPQVTTARDGSCVLEFYTSDVTGTFQVVVQGLTKNGDAGSTVQTFTVR